MSTVRIVIGSVGSVLLVGALILLAGTPSVAPHVLAAEQYFGCPPGYQFQAKDSGARCISSGTTSTADIQCAFGYFKTLDQFNGGKDGCQNKSNVVANYTCPSGFSPKVQAGPDRCEKFTPPSIIAPTVSKSL